MKLLGLTLLLIVHSPVKCGFDNRFAEIIPAILLWRTRMKPMMCIYSCKGMPDGDYHSCKGCLYFATCTNGYLVDARKCAWFGGLLWDDNRKRCEWTSPTCSQVEYNAPRIIPIGKCLDECFGIANGNYQSCKGCRVYVTCSNGLTYDNRLCPWFLLWDDNSKSCLWRSRTCKEPLSW